MIRATVSKPEAYALLVATSARMHEAQRSLRTLTEASFSEEPDRGLVHESEELFRLLNKLSALVAEMEDNTETALDLTEPQRFFGQRAVLYRMDDLRSRRVSATPQMLNGLATVLNALRESW